MSIKVRGGTPHHGGPGLCHSCKHSHVFRSAAESEITVLCALPNQYGAPSFRIRKPVVECSEYANKLEKSEYEMKQIAWILASRGGKPIGFISPREARRKAEAKEIDPLEDD
jgi:hypothetical protein